MPLNGDGPARSPTSRCDRSRPLSRADVPYAGGKGANLGELTAAGLPVPDGFVVGASAYAAFCDAGGLRSRIEARLATVDVDDTDALATAAAELREMVEAEPVPGNIEAAIRDAYVGLSGEDADLPVAVRSSATAEDTEASRAPRGARRRRDLDRLQRPHPADARR